MMSVLSTVCSLYQTAVAVGIHTSVAVDTALIRRQSVISNQTAVMAQRRVMLHVLNTTGIILVSVIRLYQHSVANQTGYPPKRQENLWKAWKSFIIAG